MKSLFLALAAISVLSTNVLAQPEDITIYSPERWSITFSTSSDSLTEDAAASLGIKNSAISVLLGANYYSNNWISSGAADFILYNDNNEVSQFFLGDGLFSRFSLGLNIRHYVSGGLSNMVALIVDTKF